MDFVIIEFHLLKMSFIGFHLIEWFSLIGTLETVNRGFFLCWCMPYTCRYIRIDRGAVISSMNVNTPHSRYRRETVRRNNWLTSFWITHTKTRKTKRKKTHRTEERTQNENNAYIHLLDLTNIEWKSNSSQHVVWSPWITEQRNDKSMTNLVRIHRNDKHRNQYIENENRPKRKIPKPTK